MKALTIKQPWAALIAVGLKPIENRKRRINYRGPLLIHVSGKMPFKPAAWDRFCEDHPEAAGIDYKSLLEQCGRIICQVELIDCIPIASLPKNLQGHWTAEGPMCWILQNPRPFDGMPKAKGNQNTWNYQPG